MLLEKQKAVVHGARAALDALDAQAVEQHLAQSVMSSGGIDVSLNAIGLGHARGSSLAEMSHAHFALCRQLAADLGPSGVRVICLRSAGSPDAPGVDAAFRLHAESAGLSREAFSARAPEKTLLERLPKLAEVDRIAHVAVLMAYDRASAMTVAIANVTCGEMVD